MIRSLKLEDMNELRTIYEKYYVKEFDFPEFVSTFAHGLVIEDDVSGRIISGGGIRAIAESVILTNKDFSPRVRKVALLEILHAQLFAAAKLGFGEGLHVFVQDEKWVQQLKQYGFRNTRGTSLVIG